MKKGVIVIGIVLLIIILVSFVFYIRNLGGELHDNEGKKLACVEDSDCVPDSCCHADGCVNSDSASECLGIFCTAVCSGPLDCGAGSCKCIDSKCSVVSN